MNRQATSIISDNACLFEVIFMPFYGIRQHSVGMLLHIVYNVRDGYASYTHLRMLGIYLHKVCKFVMRTLSLAP